VSEVLNDSGLAPVEYKILIKPEKIEETDPTLARARALGLELTHDTTERERMAQVKGVLIAVGGNAFQDWNEPIPKVGDVVFYAKYAGMNVRAKDGAELRLCNDKDVSAIVRPS
jgi:co-chaperonin GroES (HSP10)